MTMAPEVDVRDLKSVRRAAVARGEDCRHAAFGGYCLGRRLCLARGGNRIEICRRSAVGAACCGLTRVAACTQNHHLQPAGDDHVWSRVSCI